MIPGPVFARLDLRQVPAQLFSPWKLAFSAIVQLRLDGRRIAQATRGLGGYGVHRTSAPGAFRTARNACDRLAIGDERQTTGVPFHATSSSRSNQIKVAKAEPVQRRHLPQ